MNVPTYKGKPPKCVGGKYYLYEKIGEGAWAKVRRCMEFDADCGKLCEYACKIYYQCVVNRKLKGGIERLRNEFRLVNSALKHPNVLEYKEMLMDDDKVYVIMELCPQGSVESLLNSGDLNLNQVKKIMIDLLTALDYIHSKNVSHHDVKPGNLLLSKHGDVKLADFGVAEVMQSDGKSVSPFGTPAYQAPEVLNVRRDTDWYDGRKSDIWSAGILLYQLCYQRLPWKHETVYMVMKEICEVESIELAPCPYGEDCLDLLTKMLCKDPVKRPFAKEALKHNFFLNSR